MKKSVPSSKKTAILKHFRASRMKLPKVPLARRPVLARHFDKTVVETEIVTDGILPRGPALTIIGKLLNDVIANLTQSEHLVGRLRDGHCYECNV